MKCPFCGAKIKKGVTLCPKCEKDLTEELTEAEERAEETAEEAAEELAEAAEESVEEAEEAVEETEETAEDTEEITPDALEDLIVLEDEPDDGEEEPKKKSAVIPIILCGLAACAIVAMIVFSSQIIGFFKGIFTKREAVQFTSEVLSTRDVYTVKDITSSDDARLSTVVATCGDVEFTNANLQVYYRNSYYQFMNQYGMYAQLLGLDSSLPLWEQYASEGVTWEQHFLSEGLTNANELAAARQYCLDNGIELGEDLQGYIDTLPSDLESNAQMYGFATADEYIQDSYGKAVTVSVFTRYFECMAYEEAIYNSLTCTEDEVNAFYDANPDLMTSYGIGKQTVSVRHILIKPEDADGDEVSTDEEWQAASDEADRIYALYCENPTEDYFIELSGQYNQDPGSMETGGLYEGVLPGQMVTEFNDWIFAEGRKNADTAIVKTDYGYHIMFFVSIEENSDWYEACESLCLNDKMTAKLAEITAQYPLMVYVDDIVIDDVQQLDAAANEG